MCIRVLLVDDHKVIRSGLAALLEKENDITVVGKADNGREALAKAMELKPDVLVMDLILPDMGGVRAMRLILEAQPEIRALALSMLLDETSVVESLEAGARGYLTKDSAADELVSAIRSVYRGEPYLCSGVQEILIDRCKAISARRA